MLIMLAVLSSVISTSSTRIVAFGDSLTAGYGLAAEEAFPVRLEKALTLRGYSVKVENAGVSGDTTTGGLSRLAWALGNKPATPGEVVIVELGANDAMRGVDPKVTYEKLAAILTTLKARGSRVLLAGMKAPPNMGPAFVKEFDSIFPRLEKAFPEVVLYPFFLEGVAAVPELNQKDGIHPNPKGVAVIVEKILPFVERVLK